MLIRKIGISQFEQSTLSQLLLDLYSLPLQHFVYETIRRYLQVMVRFQEVVPLLLIRDVRLLRVGYTLSLSVPHALFLHIHHHRR